MMKETDTIGNKISRPIQCPNHCGSTAGCVKCMPRMAKFAFTKEDEVHLLNKKCECGVPKLYANPKCPNH